MAIFQNAPIPAPGQYGHDDEGVLHLNVPEQGLVPIPKQLAPADLQNSPSGSSGGAPASSVPAPAIDGNALANSVNAQRPAMTPVSAVSPPPAPAKNDLGMVIQDASAGGRPPVSPFQAPVNTEAQPILVPQIQTIKESKTESKKIRPEDRASMDKANEAVANAIHADANVQAAKSNAEAALLDARAQDLQQQSQKMQEAEVQRQKAIAERMADVDKEIAKQSAMSVDPNYFGRMDTGSKIASIIGILVSGIGAGLQGGGAQNLAIDQMNKTVDRDIEAQKANIAKQGSVVAAKRGGYQDFLNATQDQRAAELAEHNRQSEIFKTRLEQVAAKTNDPIIKATAEKNIAAINSQQANNIAQIQAVATEQGTKKQVTLGGGKKEALTPGAASIVKEYTAAKTARGLIDQFANTVTAAGKEGKTGPAKGRIKTWIEMTGYKTDVSKFNSDRRNFAATVTRQLFGGNASDKDTKRIEEMVPLASDTPELAATKLQSLKDFADVKVAEQENAMKAFRVPLSTASKK